MKFLPRVLDNSNLMILRTYYDGGTNDFQTPDDVLDIVYKDIDTGTIYTESIPNPKIEVYIVKPEKRTYQHYKAFVPIEDCDKYLVSYKFRYAEVANILGCATKEAKYSKYVCQLDIDIEHYYMMQFYIEYDRKETKPITLGFSDIENDIIQLEPGVFPEPGQAPINVVSYFDEATDTMYTVVCVQDNVPHVPEGHKRHEYYEKLRARFKTQTDYFVNHLDDLIEECKTDFTPIYGEIDYKILVYEDEVSALKAYWEIVELCQNDYGLFWNAPYDISNLVERLRTLGIEPESLIKSADFGDRKINWHEDRNPKAHKRKHIFDLFNKTSFIDHLVLYAGVRSGRGKIPSLKLNAVGKTELEDEKVDYSEYGNIRLFPYADFWKFIKYNIKDVLIEVGIERKVHDIDFLYMIMTTSALRIMEVFTSTLVVGGSLRLYSFIEKNHVMGSNKNKLFRVKKTAEQIKQEKKDKFAGAFVMNPAHCSPTGHVLLGILNKYIHDYVIDMDITSEYPTGMQISNSSNDTLVGKVFLNNPDEIEIELYQNMYFVDSDDEEGYYKTADKGNLMMEGLSENNPTAFGEVFLNLPSFTSIAEHIADNINDFI